jgi:serine/threonine-protein kinase
VACWGDNSEGGLGDGTQVNRAVPAFVQGALAGKTVTQIAMGSFQGCALAAGLVYCWGGYEDGVFHTQPTLVPGLSGVTQIAVSGRASCALAAGELWCWGRHDYGLWRGAGYEFPLPQKVPMTGALSGAVIDDVAIGPRMACVVTGDELACWGSQAGGAAVVDWVDDGALSAAGAPERISVGYQHACAIEGGMLACWYGTTSRALLGRTDVYQSTAPVAVDATGVLAGGSCAAGWVMTAAERCAPGAGIDVGYRVSYTKRGWASPAVDALVTWAGSGGEE